MKDWRQLGHQLGEFLVTIFSMAVVPDYQLKKQRDIISGFVLLLEVLEKPWNLILDFKGT